MRIGHAHIVQHGIAVDVPVDPADGDVEAVGKDVARDPVSEETLPDGGVEKQDRAHDQQHRAAE